MLVTLLAAWLDKTGGAEALCPAPRQPSARSASAAAVTLRIGTAERQAVARALQVGAHHAARRVECSVEEQPLDALVIVEVLDVPQVGYGRPDVGVQVGRAVPGDLQ